MFSPRFFKQRITISRGTSTATASGGISRAGANLFEGISASVQPNPTGQIGREKMEFATPQVLATHRIYTTTDVSSARKDDRVTDDESGQTFTVRSVADQAGRAQLWCIFADTK